MFPPLASLLPYAHATAAQRAQARHYLQARLRLHFPTLPERFFVRALAEFRPALLLTGTSVTLLFPELTQLVQYLAGAPELPLLDPPPATSQLFAVPASRYPPHDTRLITFHA